MPRFPGRSEQVTEQLGIVGGAAAESGCEMFHSGGTSAVNTKAGSPHEGAGLSAIAAFPEQAATSATAAQGQPGKRQSGKQDA